MYFKYMRTQDKTLLRGLFPVKLVQFNHRTLLGKLWVLYTPAVINTHSSCVVGVKQTLYVRLPPPPEQVLGKAGQPEVWNV